MGHLMGQGRQQVLLIRGEQIDPSPQDAIGLTRVELNVRRAHGPSPAKADRLEIIRLPVMKHDLARGCPSYLLRVTVPAGVQFIADCLAPSRDCLFFFARTSAVDTKARRFLRSRGESRDEY